MADKVCQSEEYEENVGGKKVKHVRCINTDACTNPNRPRCVLQSRRENSEDEWKDVGENDVEKKRQHEYRCICKK